MKKKKVSLPISFAAVWILIQMALFMTKVPHHFRIGALVNLLFILLVVIGSLHKQVSEEKQFHPFASNFKNSLKNAGKYIIVVGLFLFCYLKFINPAFLQNQNDARVEQALAVPLEKVQEKFPQFETYEEYETSVRESSKILSSSTLILSFYFLLMFMISVLYSILVPLFYKKIILRI